MGIPGSQIIIKKQITKPFKEQGGQDLAYVEHIME
jgi:hypothetical protein